MNSEELSKYKCNNNVSIVDAMKSIDKNACGLVYIVNSEDKLVGCLTDGDIRRWIITYGGVAGTVSDAMNHNPKYVFQSEAKEGLKRMNEERVHSIAVVNDHMMILDVIFLESYKKLKQEISRSALKDTVVIVMAGGEGTRLFPYTKILPKPLIPIGDVPILERILNRFSNFGVTDFYLTVNYKKEMIKSYFSEIIHSYDIHYVDEDKPLGTAGSIRLIKKKFDRPVIVTNCDILIEADYEKILNYHIDSSNDITIVSSLKNTIIPYGVIHTRAEGIVECMEEKPQLSHFINTGMYVINPELFKWIPQGIIFHMTDLVNKVMVNKKKVGMFPISEKSFLDMGQFEEMKKMEERINGGYVQ